jgi:rhodanese-related sulfurtransferase/ABC-type phosphate/phosphonate transport system substrate-binding protein
MALLAMPAMADISALVVSEPTSRKDGLMLSRGALEAGLGKLLGQPVKVTVSDDLTDAMRATRSGGYDVFIAPPQVAASALGHGYELVGSTDGDEQYVLVGKPGLGSLTDMRAARIYLPQQDSIYTYMARGMLTAGGLSFKDLRTVEYARYPQAGLTAINMRLSEATVIRREDWDSWDKLNPGAAKVLATSGSVPGGLSVAIRKDLPADERSKVAKWFATSAPSCGMKPVAMHSDLSRYQRVAELGTFTPSSLPGATVVNAEDVKRLMAQGAVLVDTRNDKEYKQKHIPGARFVPYHEKSLKDVAYEGKLDDFSGIGTLDSKAPTIFQCNGAECWKSYKASRAAIAAGFSKVYWFRGGMPEWEAAGQQVAKE